MTIQYIMHVVHIVYVTDTRYILWPVSQWGDASPKSPLRYAHVRTQNIALLMIFITKD